MTRTQQLILLIILLLLLVVTGLLAVTLIRTRDTASAVPTLTLISTLTVPPTRLPADTSTPITVPPTWTVEPTRTPRFTSTPGPTRTATAPPSITPTFAPTFTPRPTAVVTASPAGPTLTLGLVNPGFEKIGDNKIPGWSWWAEDNFTPGGEYNPDTSFETPLFKSADDPVRFIDGPTLQIDAVQHLKFRVHVYQTVPVSPTARVGFQVSAGAFSDTGAVQIAAGIDPRGGRNCDNARWSAVLYIDQVGGVKNVVAPTVTTGSAGRVTVCLLAEPLYAAVSNAAFFDEAELIVEP
jgi:hypothetical protein